MTIRVRQENALDWKQAQSWARVSRRTPSAPAYRIVKRGIDVLVSVLVIVGLMSWLLPILMLLIVIGSKGSPFFNQKRTGKNGKIFTCYKLRTMVPNSQADTVQATDHDERITRIGHFLRATSLDELPQFFNVLRGDMSLVGPRPHMVYHTKKYGDLIPTYHLRLAVRPGITGLAQVKGFRGPTRQIRDMENRVREDLKYISYLSWRMDLRILLLTIVEMGKSLRK